MVDRINNFIQIFNEHFVLVSIQSLFLFTNYVEDPIVRYQFGFYFIYMIGANITVNLIVLIANILYAIYVGLRRSYTKRQARIAHQKVYAEKAANQDETEGQTMIREPQQQQLDNSDESEQQRRSR